MPVGVVGEGGRVVSVLVEPGDWVRAGQVLAVIDRSVQTQQAQSSAAQIEVARADANLAQANLDRALQAGRPRLHQQGRRRPPDRDARRRQRARPRRRGAVSASCWRATRRLNIVAPAAGLVLERNVEPGQVVGAGGTRAVHASPRAARWSCSPSSNEDDLAALAVGATAERHAGRQRQDLHRPDLADFADHRSADPPGHRAHRAAPMTRRSGPAASPSAEIAARRDRRAAAARKRDPVGRQGQLRLCRRQRQQGACAAT